MEINNLQVYDGENWINLGGGSLFGGGISFAESGESVINGAVGGVLPNELIIKVEFSSNIKFADFVKKLKKREKTLLSKAEYRRAVIKARIYKVKVFGEGKLVRLWGLSRVHCLTVGGMSFYYQDWRKNPRRALIIIDGEKTPVRLRGKK